MHPRIFFIIGIIYFTTSVVFSQTDRFNRLEENKVYQQVANVVVTTPTEQVALSSLYSRTPLIIALIFTRCTGVCSPMILNLYENINHLQSDKNFKVLVLSFDSMDNIKDMSRFATRYGLENNKQWIFATTSQIKELNISIGFNPIWDTSKKQFNHEALFVGINKDGYITKKVVGIRSYTALADMIKEINNEFVISYPLPKINMLFSCFDYNPITGKKKPSWGLLILLLPFIITCMLLILLVKYTRKN